MSLRNLLEQEILIRLTESGFVETIRYCGVEQSLAYEMDESQPAEAAPCDESLIFALVRAWRNQKNAL